GLYQARSAIARKKYCILVEGYMDVISLHQSGVENVVASSGTALTEGQVALIKRFASKVTLMYDSDFAGIKAALRGINMFVAAGIALKLVLLPDGEDPDSFAQSHTSAEVEEYIAEHEEDLIAFKTEILMKDSGDDPRLRSEAINDILETISLIPDPIEQTLYIDKCASKVGINPVTLRNQVKVIVARRMEKDYDKRRREESAATLSKEKQEAPEIRPQAVADDPDIPRSIYMAEQEVLTYALRYGALYLCDVLDGEASLPMTTVDYISREFALDNISFSVPKFRAAWEEVTRLQNEEWESRRNDKVADLRLAHDKELEAAREQIRATASSVEEINTLDEKAVEQARVNYEAAVDDFDAGFVRDRLLRGDDRDMIDLVLKLTTDTVVLSRMHPVVNRRDDIIEKLPRAIYQLKGALLKEEIKRLTASLDTIGSEESREIMERILRLKQQSMEFDRYNGEVVITPFLKR
ncbi:MAG: toprim domain-containing protein, partial [Muribaculaceae bacterium]|nr:toprim domain-containing protein [Muribaculaceae bacterium]